MDLEVAPGVIGEDEVGLVQADREAHLFAQRHRPLELTVVVSEKYEFLHADRLAGGALLLLARLGQYLRRHLWIVRALVATRVKAVGQLRAALAEYGESPRTPAVVV